MLPLAVVVRSGSRLASVGRRGWVARFGATVTGSRATGGRASAVVGRSAWAVVRVGTSGRSRLISRAAHGLVIIWVRSRGARVAAGRRIRRVRLVVAGRRVARLWRRGRRIATRRSRRRRIGRTTWAGRAWVGGRAWSRATGVRRTTVLRTAWLLRVRSWRSRVTGWSRATVGRGGVGVGRVGCRRSTVATTLSSWVVSTVTSLRSCTSGWSSRSARRRSIETALWLHRSRGGRRCLSGLSSVLLLVSVRAGRWGSPS